MRLAIVDWSFRDSSRHSTVQLANSLQEVAEVHLFAPPSSGSLGDTVPGVVRHATLPLNFPGQPWRGSLVQANPLVHAVNAKRIRRVVPDIVHFVEAHYANAWVLPLLVAPVCISLHGPAALSLGASPIRAHLSTRALGLADRVIVDREALCEELTRYGLARERIALIPEREVGFNQCLFDVYRRMAVGKRGGRLGDVRG